MSVWIFSPEALQYADSPISVKDFPIAKLVTTLEGELSYLCHGVRDRQAYQGNAI